MTVRELRGFLLGLDPDLEVAIAYEGIYVEAESAFVRTWEKHDGEPHAQAVISEDDGPY